MESFPAFVRMLGILVEDARRLAASEIYKQTLVECLLNPYDEDRLKRFLILDNVCKDAWLLIGITDAAALWEARKQAFDEVWAAIADFPGSASAPIDLGDRRRLRHVLLSILSARTSDSVYEWIEVGLR